MKNLKEILYSQADAMAHLANRLTDSSDLKPLTSFEKELIKMAVVTDTKERFNETMLFYFTGSKQDFEQSMDHIINQLGETI